MVTAAHTAAARKRRARSISSSPPLVRPAVHLSSATAISASSLCASAPTVARSMAGWLQVATPSTGRNTATAPTRMPRRPRGHGAPASGVASSCCRARSAPHMQAVSRPADRSGSPPSSAAISRTVFGVSLSGFGRRTGPPRRSFAQRAWPKQARFRCLTLRERDKRVSGRRRVSVKPGLAPACRARLTFGTKQQNQRSPNCGRIWVCP